MLIRSLLSHILIASRSLRQAQSLSAVINFASEIQWPLMSLYNLGAC